MLELLLASSNKDKAREFAELFDPGFISVVPAMTPPSVTEDGESFFENAEKKAQAFFRATGRPCLADDSGLLVEALPDELGIHSARFGGEGLRDSQRAQLLLEKMVGKDNPTAHFICCLCVYLKKEEIFFFEGRLSGRVAQTCRGNGGFGYDPVFIPDKYGGEKTLAQIPQWKKAHSHRALACRKAQNFLKVYRDFG